MRLHAALLRLYPASFRLEYGDEMRAMFDARRSETTGVLPTIRLWSETIGDTMLNAAAAHWDILRQDLRYAIRALAKSPGFAITAILVLAVGIGANTAAFSVADFVLIRPLPYADPGRLVKLAERPQLGGMAPASPAIYRDWKATSQSFSALGAYYGRGVNLVGGSEPVHLEQSVVTASLLPLLGVRPIQGRLFDASDERQSEAGVVILSYALWQGQFGGDAAILGKRLLVDGTPRIVVGVMPQDFHFPNREVALWTPVGGEQDDPDHTNTYWEVLGRLRPDVTLERARAEMSAITGRLAQQYPSEIEGMGVSVTRLADGFSNQSRLLLLALCGAAACVLLIACANLANLLLARALRRHREVLVRVALGAGRERLVRQSVTESVLLALLGGLLGIGIAIMSLPLLTRLVPNTLPIAAAPSVDPRIVLFAILLSLVTGVVFGVFPAWRTASSNDLSDLREGARGIGGRQERARSALVIAEVMASVVLLISAGLLLRSLLRVQDTDPGFRTEHVMVFRTALPSPRYDSTARRAAFYRDVLGDVRSIPGVSAASYISGLPMASNGGVWPVSPEGRGPITPRSPNAIARYVTPGFFPVLGIPLRRGRDVSETDDLRTPWVAVVSESFAKRFWPGEDPIGKRFMYLMDMRTVIGVVGDVRVRGLERESEPQVYLSYKQAPDGAPSFFFPKEMVVRYTGSSAALVPAVHRAVDRVDPEQPVSNVRPMAEILSDATAARSVQVRVLGAFALIAYLLAAIGIHGLLSFSVSSRQREIGVRMALGAERGQVMRMIMKKAVVLAAAGAIPGIVIAYVAGRAMQGLLFGIEPADGVTFAVAAILCFAMTLAGSFAPTLRAVHVDPATALRADA